MVLFYARYDFFYFFLNYENLWMNSCRDRRVSTSWQVLPVWNRCHWGLECPAVCMSALVFIFSLLRGKVDICQRFCLSVQERTGDKQEVTEWRKLVLTDLRKGNIYSERLCRICDFHICVFRISATCFVSAWNTFLVKPLDLIASFGATLLCLLQLAANTALSFTSWTPS